ncbi:MAG: hypothetical protein II556_04410 [Bacteroidales bacterium]|nr:hypothetical protein [Bacteroidales bacterium]
MKRFLPLLLLLGAFACSTVRQLPSTDSTKVEVRTETVTVHDTAYVELPVIIEKVATLDTTSTLENKFARSEASVSAGILSHTLETKPVQLPVQVETKIVYKDSLVYRDRVQTQTVEVEKKLTAWQQAKMKLGSVAILLIGLAIIYLIYLIVKRF